MRYFVFTFLGFYLGMMLTISLLKESRQPAIYQSSITKINTLIPELNEGGCGFFALKLYRRLDSSRYSIVAIGNREHIAIMDKAYGNIIDSKGCHSKTSIDLRYNYPEYITLSEKELQMLVATQKWNKQFNLADTTCINQFIDNL